MTSRTAVVLVWSLWLGARGLAPTNAWGQPSVEHAAHGGFGAGLTKPADRNRPVDELETRLMGDLACVCGTCNLEPIRDCACPFAAELRGFVQAELRGRDRSTAAARQAAYEQVRAAALARYGATVVTPHRLIHADDRLGWLPGAIFLVGLAWLGWVTARSLRRKRRRADAEPPLV